MFKWKVMQTPMRSAPSKNTPKPQKLVYFHACLRTLKAVVQINQMIQVIQATH
jgi:hypothetical protein